MTEENVTLPTNPSASNTFTISSPASTATATIPWTTIPWTWTWPSSYTTGYLYAQLSEQQLGDLEERFRKVMRGELKFLLSQVLNALADEESDEDKDNEDDEEA